MTPQELLRHDAEMVDVKHGRNLRLIAADQVDALVDAVRALQWRSTKGTTWSPLLRHGS